MAKRFRVEFTADVPDAFTEETFGQSFEELLDAEGLEHLGLAVYEINV